MADEPPALPVLDHPAPHPGPPPPKGRFRFTSDNARHFAARSALARRGELNPPPPPHPATAQAEAPAGFIGEQLTRVREQVAMIDALLAKARDPLDLDRLCRAKGSLLEQERILAGRPLPGALRPTKSKGTANEALTLPVG